MKFDNLLKAFPVIVSLVAMLYTFTLKSITADFALKADLNSLRYELLMAKQEQAVNLAMIKSDVSYIKDAISEIKNDQKNITRGTQGK
jgi:hypothetical protein